MIGRGLLDDRVVLFLLSVGFEVRVLLHVVEGADKSLELALSGGGRSSLSLVCLCLMLCR